MNEIIKRNWYVLQVINGKEEKIESIMKKINNIDLLPFLPRKMIKLRKNCQYIDCIKPLYPGYLFVIGNWNIYEAKNIVSFPGVVKFIGGLIAPKKLEEIEKKIICSITKSGCVQYSKVINVGSKIKVIDGPLKLLEGVIEDVDRRKKRAFVRIPIMNNPVRVSLGFEFIELI